MMIIIQVIHHLPPLHRLPPLNHLLLHLAFVELQQRMELLVRERLQIVLGVGNINNSLKSKYLNFKI